MTMNEVIETLCDLLAAYEEALAAAEDGDLQPLREFGDELELLLVDLTHDEDEDESH